MSISDRSSLTAAIATARDRSAAPVPPAAAPPAARASWTARSPASITAITSGVGFMNTTTQTTASQTYVTPMAVCHGTVREIMNDVDVRKVRDRKGLFASLAVSMPTPTPLG